MLPPHTHKKDRWSILFLILESFSASSVVISDCIWHKEEFAATENIHICLKEYYKKFQGGVGFQKPKFIEESMKQSCNSQGWGAQTKNLS